MNYMNEVEHPKDMQIFAAIEVENVLKGLLCTANVTAFGKLPERR